MGTERIKMRLLVLTFAGSFLCSGLVVGSLDAPAEDVPVTSTVTFVAWHCTFAEGLCDLAPTDTAKTTWERTDVLDPLPSAKDSWSVQLSQGMSPGDKAGLVSPSVPPSNTPRCLSFYYFFNGSEAGRLTVLLRTNAGPDVLVWTRSQPAGPKWTAANIDLNLPVSFSVVFEGVKGSNSMAVVGLDEVSLKNAPCDTLLPTLDVFNRFVCEFEEDLCDFTLEDKAGRWYWTHYNDPEADFAHPHKDHTYSTSHGKYLVAPLRSSKNGMVGKVLTPKYSLEAHQTQCLTFWYIFNGQSNKDFLLVHLIYGLDAFPTAMWRETNNHFPTWLEAKISIPSGHMNFQVEWVAYQQSEDVEGFIAIDDVKLFAQECPFIGSCTFEDGTCGWQNLLKDASMPEDKKNVSMPEYTYDWLLGSGRNQLNKGPEADHYGNTSGNFLYIDGVTVGTAVLESQLLVLEHHSDFCFSFWYFIQGKEGDEVSISVVTESGKETVVWEAGVSHGWTHGQVRVNATELIPTEVYQLYIRGTYTSNGSVIAVDDFMVKKDFECPRVLDGSVVGEPLELSTPAPIELWSCNFSTGKCGLNITGNGNWYLYVNTNTTQHNDDGYCLGFIGVEGDEGRAALPHQPAQEGTSCLSFWYMIGSANRGNLSVALMVTGPKREPWDE